MVAVTTHRSYTATSKVALAKTVVFVAIEGVDGAGKSTTACAVVKALRNDGYTVHAMSEPQWNLNRDQGSDLRRLMLRTAQDITLPEARNMAMYGIMCFLRASTYAKIHSLQCDDRSNSIILVDRYVLSTLIYQGVNAKCRSAMLSLCATMALPMPDITYLIKVSPLVAQHRVVSRNESSTANADTTDARMRLSEEFERDRRAIARRTRLYDSIKLAKQVYTRRLVVIDGSQPPNEVCAAIYDDIISQASSAHPSEQYQ